MGLETAKFISQLDKLAPLSGDQRKQGDDHLRLIKAVLKETFPGKNGQGFAKAITATEDEINLLSGATANFQQQLNALKSSWSAPVGTIAVVYQATAPTGWVNVNWGKDYVLVTAGTTGGASVGGGGGAGHNIVTGCTVVASHTHVTDPARINTNTDSHTHTYKDGFAANHYGTDLYPGENLPTENVNVSGQWEYGGHIHNRQLVTNADSHFHSVDIPATVSKPNAGADVWQPKYITVIGIRKS